MFVSILLLFGVLVADVGVSNALDLEFTIEIDPARRECFHQEIKQGTSFEFEYQVVDGGDMDISCHIMSPSGKTLVSEMKQTESVHKLEAHEPGDYSFCLDNTFSRFSSKLVFFELITDEEVEGHAYEDLPQETELDIKLEDFKESLSKIREHVDKGRQIQNVLRAIETRDRSIAEANFERVNFWSGVQVFVMVSVAITHVLMIRSLFEDHRSGKLKVRT